MRSLSIALALALAPAFGLCAQDTTLTRILVANRHTVSLADGRLAGDGGRLLVDEGKKARFFLVGEEHGVAQTPQVVQALLRELRPAGYNTLAIEISPLQGQRINALSGRAGSDAALDSLMATWYSSIPFYTLAEERAMLASTLRPSGDAAPMRIWGLDYDVSADRFYLRELETLAPPSGKAAVRRARESADSGFAMTFSQHNPSKLFAWSAPDSVFTALRAAFGGTIPARARDIIDLFERTARINRLFLSGRGYESNLMRSQFMRENLAKALAASEHQQPAPRVLFKFGGSHMMRGWNYTNTLDLGTAATIVAEGRGERAFNLLVLGGAGSKSSRMNILSGQYEPTGKPEVELPFTTWLLPALARSGWSLFDMGAVRREYLSGGSTLNAAQDRFLHAYDAILVLTGSTPGTVRPLAIR
ncbi:MAG: hypothetical protein U0132_08510 [Gemmatimonadaceae bacterium]